MKILFISEGYSIGGTSRVMSRLSEIFINGGFEVDILVPNYRANEAYPIMPECNLYYVAKDENIKSKFLLGIDLVKFFFKLIAINKTNDYDYVISFWNYVNLLLLLTPIKLKTKKIICSHIPYGSLKLHWKILTRIMYPLADFVVVLNEREKEIYNKFCSRVKIIENPLPVRSTNSIKNEQKK